MPQDQEIHKAAGRGVVLEITPMLEACADEDALKAMVNAVGSQKGQPIHRAANAGATDVTNLLLSKGAAIEAVDRAGRTPLLFACTKGHQDVVKLLLESWGADPNAATKSGTSCVIAAALGGHLNCVKLLIWFGQESGREVDLQRTNQEGKTALDVAKEAKHDKVANVIAFKLSTGAVTMADLNEAELKPPSSGCFGS